MRQLPTQNLFRFWDIPKRRRLRGAVSPPVRNLAVRTKSLLNRSLARNNGALVMTKSGVVGRGK